MNISRIAAAFARLHASRRGNVLMIFAFAMIPMVFATGMGVDYSRAARLQTKMNALADAAALAAVTQPMMQEPAGDACDAARNIFTVQSTDLADQGLVFKAGQTKQFKVTVTDTLPNVATPVATVCKTKAGTSSTSEILPLSRTATVSYIAASTNSFAGVLGLDTLPIAGGSTAKTTLAPYIDIHMALDTSQSMGLAATDDDAAKLWQITSAPVASGGNNRGCQFGCHVTAPGDQHANADLAAQVGAKLRVDVLREAAEDMMQTAIADEEDKKLYRFRLYRIGGFNPPADIVASGCQPLTSDIAGCSLASVKNLTLGPNDSGGTGDTNFVFMTNYLAQQIKVAGEGVQPTDPRAYLFLVTDGVADVAGGCTYGHCTRPIDPTTCDALRKKFPRLIIGVVYTTYLPVKADPLNPSSTALRDEYTQLVKKFSEFGYSSPNPADNSADIQPALEKCANPGWFYAASDGPAIHAAIQRLFSQATQTPVITH